jgi:hypothetical protein
VLESHRKSDRCTGLCRFDEGISIWGAGGQAGLGTNKVFQPQLHWCLGPHDLVVVGPVPCGMFNHLPALYPLGTISHLPLSPSQWDNQKCLGTLLRNKMALCWEPLACSMKKPCVGTAQKMSSISTVWWKGSWRREMRVGLGNTEAKSRAEAFEVYSLYNDSHQRILSREWNKQSGKLETFFLPSLKKQILSFLLLAQIFFFFFFT